MSFSILTSLSARFCTRTLALGHCRSTLATLPYLPRHFHTQHAVMQSGRNSTATGGASLKPGATRGISSTLTTDNSSSAVPARLMINDRQRRTPSPRGANGDDDSEAESYRDGRSDAVDRETRGRAYAWCRDFLSGSWKTISEQDFQISIVRLVVDEQNTCTFGM